MPAEVHDVNVAGDAGVPLTKRTAEVRYVNAASRTAFKLTKCTAWGCSTFHSTSETEREEQNAP